MASIVLNNAPRGCGQLKKGGCYGGGLMSPNGTLRVWTWILGEPWLGGHNVDGASVPSRTQIEVNPLETLHWEYIWRTEWGLPQYDPETPAVNPEIPQWGIADHVGSCFYRPEQFAIECAQRGPSRRFSPANAKKWAKRVPFPILFTTDLYPYFEDEASVNAWMKAQIERENAAEGIETNWKDPSWLPTWYDPEFTIYAGGKQAARSPMLDLFYYETAGKPPLPQREQYRTVFGISWITFVTYVAEPDEEVPEDLAEAGVVKGVLEEDL